MGKGKRLKEQSVQKAQEQSIQPVARIEILVFPGNKVTVNGFPTNLEAAMSMLSSAQIAIAKYFVGKAVGGGDSAPKILVPNRSIVLPNGQRS